MKYEDIDQRIRAALNVDPSPDQMVRLVQFWQQQSRHEKRRGTQRRVALAASIAAAATAGIWLWTSDPPAETPRTNPPASVAEKEKHIEPAPLGPAEAAVAGNPRPGTRSGPVGQPPTTYERLAFVTGTGRSVPDRPSMPTPLIDDLIEEINKDPAAATTRIEVRERLAESGAEVVLLRRLQQSGNRETIAILKLLAICGSSDVIPAVLELGRREKFRGPAVSAVEQIVGVGALADVLRQTNDGDLRAALIRQMLTADDETALRGYLSLMYDAGPHGRGLRAEALAVARSVPELPVASLIALLDDDKKKIRLSAAIVLGHVNGPRIAEALISEVLRDASSHTEVWMALLACRDELAVEFLAFASVRPQLLAHLNSARVQFGRMTP